MAIRSFKDRRGPVLFGGQCPKGFPPDLVRTARRKLRAVDAAVAVGDLTAPPGNRLEK
jgi:toxin HigB-1